MKIKAQDILNVITRFDKKLIDEKELSDWAIEQLEKDIETESLILLAGMTPFDNNDALELLKKALSEFDYPWPSQDLINLAYAKIIAGQIVAGEIDPNIGCTKIGEINHQLNWPEELSTFGMLAHEQTDHEHIGITSESVIPEIISAAKELVQIKLNI